MRKLHESEKTIEKELVKFITDQGGLCRKFTSPGHKGVPDRICFMPHGIVFLVETKSSGDKPRPEQVREHKRLKDLGFNVYVVSTLTELNNLKEKIWTTQPY